jgi:hypothetical protein
MRSSGWPCAQFVTLCYRAPEVPLAVRRLIGCGGCCCADCDALVPRAGGHAGHGPPEMAAAAAQIVAA